jgi:hypothetical protein
MGWSVHRQHYKTSAPFVGSIIVTLTHMDQAAIHLRSRPLRWANGIATRSMIFNYLFPIPRLPRDWRSTSSEVWPKPIGPSKPFCVLRSPLAGRCVTFCGYELSPSGQASNWTWILPNWIWITHNLHKRRLGWDDVARVASAFFHVEVRVASATCHVGVQLFVGLVHGRTCRKPWLSFTADNQKWYRESMGDSKDSGVPKKHLQCSFFWDMCCWPFQQHDPYMFQYDISKFATIEEILWNSLIKPFPPDIQHSPETTV